MKFRTEIGPIASSFSIDHDDRIVMLGSCFADNIGAMLQRDGFHVVHNPLGPLYNPESLCRIIRRGAVPYGARDFFEYNGTFHCLDFASRYQNPDPEALARAVNDDYLPLAQALESATVLILTLGTAKVYRLDEKTVGNCHKIPGKMFSEHLLTVDEAIRAFDNVILPQKCILTLSPVRYPGEGLPKGSLAKAVLRVAIEDVCRQTGADYFPAFEIVNDDLRDYRFYASDMRHPSEQAVQYIYENFAQTYFSDDTKVKADEFRKRAMQMQHRPILNS